MHRIQFADFRSFVRLNQLACVICTLFLPASVAMARGAEDYLDKDEPWYEANEAATIAANVLSWQSPLGGWPKNLDTTTATYSGDVAEIEPTFDNGATVNELRFLARMAAATQQARYREAFDRGLNYILQAQYPTGGWPQRHPPGRSYARHITFNDNAMARLMIFLREVASEDAYSFVANDKRTAARAAFDRGVECILKCQIQVDGRLTAWCAQHDEVSFEPRPARTYELVSLSGSESVGIVRLLLSLEEPSPEVVRAIESAIAWLDSSKIEGIRVERRRDPSAPRSFNKVVVEDPTAEPLWARFYDIQTNRPIFCDRDGVPNQNLADIGHERRNGYAWYGDWAEELLEDEYPAWRESLATARERDSD